MKTITVSARAKALNELLKQARAKGLILQSADGRRFVLASIETWEGFDVGASDDFAREVQRTTQNKKLMKALARRRGQGQKVPLSKVKEQLGLG